MYGEKEVHGGYSNNRVFKSHPVVDYRARAMASARICAEWEQEARQNNYTPKQILSDPELMLRFRKYKLAYQNLEEISGSHSTHSITSGTRERARLEADLISVVLP